MTINLSSGGTDYNPAFCLGGTVIPALEPNETYSFWYYRTVNFTYGREIYPTLYYLDSNKNNFSLCNEPLRQTGTWYAGINFNPNSPIGVHVNIGGFTIIDPLANIAYPPIFKVYDKETVLSLEQQQATLDLTRQANNASGVVTKLTIITVIVAIISLIVSIIGILFPLYHTKEIEVDKQKEIILSITAILDMLSEERDGQLVELKRSAIPSYNLTEVDSAFYITRLSSKFANKSTVVLKKNMIKLQSKVKNINDILNLARQSLVVRSPDAANDILNELRNRNFKYHSHLTVIIHSTRAELKKLL